MEINSSNSASSALRMRSISTSVWFWSEFPIFSQCATVRNPCGWNCKLERSAPSDFRFHPDSSAPALDNSLTNRQADARTGDFASMQAFEHAEHPVGVLRIDTDSVVPHREQPPFRASLGRDMDSRCFLAAVLDRIGNEVLEKLHQHNFFGYHGRQWVGSYSGATLRDGRLEV